MTGGEVFYWLLEEEFFTETQAAALIRPVIDAVRYCHEMGICHRDLKVKTLTFSLKTFFMQQKIRIPW